MCHPVETHEEDYLRLRLKSYAKFRRLLCTLGHTTNLKMYFVQLSASLKLQK